MAFSAKVLRPRSIRVRLYFLIAAERDEFSMVLGFLGGFGSCPACMRWAFRTALGAWILVAIVARFEAPRLLLVVAIAACGVTVLWLAHLLAYGRKITSAFKRPAIGWFETSFLFTRSLGVAVALSVVPRLISADRIYRYFGFAL